MTEEKNFTPGVYSIAAERYHKADGCSKSMLDVLAEKTPAHLQAYLADQQRDDNTTEAQRFGTILHRALLEPDTFREGFHVKPDKMSFATTLGKAWREMHSDRPIISTPESAQIQAMVDAVHTHPLAKRLMANCKKEQSIFVIDEHGTLRKSRLDALPDGGNVLPDIKTVECASFAKFQRSITNYRYHVQAPYYLDNCKLAGIDKLIWVFICVEKTPPYAVRCLQLMPEVIQYGRVLYQHDIQIYRNCLETGIWPAYSDHIEECYLSDWEMKQLENAQV